MKKIIGIILISFFFSCSINKGYINPKIDGKKYEIVQLPIVYKNDTTYINELRFSKISSALNTVKLMYENFGKWDKQQNGKYQENIEQFIWLNKDLLNNGKQFNIIADGAETRGGYFASIIVLDSNNNDCLQELNPSRKALVDYFINRIDNMSSNTSCYRLFKKN